MDQAQQQEVIEQINQDLADLRKVKLKDLPLESFSGERKDWRKFKTHFQMALTDFNASSLLTQDEPFPVH
jgi:hypothetical protein